MDTSVNRTQQSNPGPGNYSIRADTKFVRDPTFVYGKEKRYDMVDRSKESLPAPNLYDVKSRIGEGPKYHIGIRSSSSMGDFGQKVPGPGAYQPKINLTLEKS